MTNTHYETRDAAAAAWLRRAKLQPGRVRVIGGGWWGIDGQKLQGLDRLAIWLEQHGDIARVPAAAGDMRGGLWRWQLQGELAGKGMLP